MTATLEVQVFFDDMFRDDSVETYLVELLKSQLSFKDPTSTDNNNPYQTRENYLKIYQTVEKYSEVLAEKYCKKYGLDGLYSSARAHVNEIYASSGVINYIKLDIIVYLNTAIQELDRARLEFSKQVTEKLTFERNFRPFKLSNKEGSDCLTYITGMSISSLYVKDNNLHYTLKYSVRPKTVPDIYPLLTYFKSVKLLRLCTIGQEDSTLNFSINGVIKNVIR